MDSHVLFPQLLQAPYTYRTLVATALRPHPRTLALLSPQLPFSHPRYITTPRILQPSFWASMIPRPLRERSSSPKRRERNPAAPYIVLGLLVGSQAIQMLWLKQERARDMRRAEAQIGLLREVIERVQRGEDVDVEKELGTGIEGSEAEWKDVLKDIEEEELLFQSRKQRKALRQAAQEKEGKTPEEQPIPETETPVQQDGRVRVETINGAKFY